MTANRATAAKPHAVGECVVCCEAYTADKRRPVICPGCDYAACVACVKMYLLGSLSDPACMSCGLYWCRAFLDASLTMSWRNGAYRKHRERVLLDRAYSLIPETQPLVEREAERRVQEEGRRKSFEEYKVAQARLREARGAWAKAGAELHRGDERRLEQSEAGDLRERRAFVAACPDAECRGFLSMQYKCGTCQKKFCARCRETKSDGVEHVCDPGTVETIALIAKVTRPCPSCGMSIERVSGCDHMWCTSCDTGFSYATGQRIANARNTNPHMYERMRQLQAASGLSTSLEDDDGQVGEGQHGCGGYYAWPRPSFRACGRREVFLLSMYNTGRHVEYALREWPTVAVDNAELRVRYCLKDIDAARFGARLQQNEKRREYLLEVRHVLESFLLMAFEFVTQLLAEPNAETCEARCAGFADNVDELINAPLQELSTRYGRATPRIVTRGVPVPPPEPVRTFWSRRPSPEVRAVQLYEPLGHVPSRATGRRRGSAADERLGEVETDTPIGASIS